MLATIVDVGQLRLRFKVSEGESLRAREGGAVSFRVAPLGPREFGARIYHVGRVADPTTRQVEVLAWVDDVRELKPGFFAEVTLAAESHKNAVVVPEGAVQGSERGFVSYVVEDASAQFSGSRTVNFGTELVEMTPIVPSIASGGRTAEGGELSLVRRGGVVTQPDWTKVRMSRSAPKHDMPGRPRIRP